MRDVRRNWDDRLKSRKKVKGEVDGEGGRERRGGGVLTTTS